MTIQEVWKWFKKHYTAIMLGVLILMVLPVLMRGLKFDGSVILSGAVSASINGVVVYYAMKAVKKLDGHDHNREDK